MSNQIVTKEKIADVLYRFKGSIEPSNIDRRAIRLLEKMDNASPEEKEQLSKKHDELLHQFVRMHEFEKHFLLAESLPPKYAAMSIKMTQSLIKEYNCNTTLEKSLVEIIVSAFCRSLHFSTSLSSIIRGEVTVEPNYVNYYNFLSKENDKAHRQYLTALSTLQQIKSPQLRVSLKAETAIVGQNQQFNSVSPNNENNKPN